MRTRSALVGSVLCAALVLAGPVRAQLAPDPVGRAVVLSEPGPHWVWVGDMLLRRAALFDGDDGRLLGMAPGGTGIIAPHRSRDGRELYVAETHYARGTRGARTDVVTITDAATLLPLGEVEIPAKRSEHVSWVAGSALSDDGRFLAVFNLNPATSLSIVDVAERRFAGEVETPGCSLVYAAGPRRFLSLCADGSALVVALDEAGGEAAKARTARFFDPAADPVTEKPVRHGDVWLFVSFEGVVHPVDVGGEEPQPGETWSLVGDSDRAAKWRIGGAQHLALHGPSGRLYALMHQGGPDTHKAPGTEVWVYDLARRERVQRIALRNPAAAFVGEQAGVGRSGVGDWLLQRLVPNAGVERILVTQDEAPVLFASTTFPATLAVYDARTGAHLRDVREVGVAGSLLQLH